jgi:hypothetical protein
MKKDSGFGSFAFACVMEYGWSKSKCAKSILERLVLYKGQISIALAITFGGMWRWRRVAVARVFALVVRCRVMMLFVYSRVGKNRDTSGSPRRQPGRPVPPATEQSSLVRKFSRHRSQ